MAFFLDFDGTLAELAPRPDAVKVPDETRRVLEALIQATGGAVAVVSGRSIWDLDRLLAPLRLPSAGQHGLERRDAAGRIVSAPVDQKAVARITRRLTQLTRQDKRLRLDPKGLSVALHYRAAPELAESVALAVAEILEEAGEGFIAQPGKMVIEVRPKGLHKGDAIAAFMAEPPFLGRLPVFAGDDLTDEHGFAAIAQFGGLSIKVGAGGTQARHRLPDVAALLLWLSGIGREVAA
jgi:trehalose 6-phosphate phosphatase